MKQFKDKTAVISGGAEGIGFGIAQALGKQGMNIVLADIDKQQLSVAHEKLESQGIQVYSQVMDVRDISQWQSLAENTLSQFGKIHLLVNNAGVAGIPGSIEQTDIKDWQWVLDVNLMGVLYGTQTMVPHMKTHGEGGWLINVASMAGMTGVPYAGAYTASKFAVVGMSESWYSELKGANIDVSVLCPAFVKTRINHSTRNKQEDYQSDVKVKSSASNKALAEQMQKVIDDGLSIEIVGERVVEAIKAKELYIFTHPNYRPVTQKRTKAIDEAFERASESELLADVLKKDVVNFG